MTTNTLADKLYDSLVLYGKIKYLPKNTQKAIMQNPEMLSEYVNQLYTDNIAV